MKNVTGTIYLIHLNEKFKHAGHYLGWASNLDTRLAHHAAGTGANFMRVIKEAGISWRVSRTWTGDRYRERQLKNQGSRARLCPICKEEKKVAAQEKEKNAEQVPEAADPGRVGAEAAQQVICAQAAAGLSVDRMAQKHGDTAAWLYNQATTPEAKQFADGYAFTAETLLGELRQAESGRELEAGA